MPRMTAEFSSGVAGFDDEAAELDFGAGIGFAFGHAEAGEAEFKPDQEPAPPAPEVHSAARFAGSGAGASALATRRTVPPYAAASASASSKWASPSQCCKSLLKRKPMPRSAVVASRSRAAGKASTIASLPSLGKAGLTGKGAPAEGSPLPDLLRIGSTIAQRQQRAVEGVGFELEEASLVDEAAGLDQLAGTGFALVGFELGFLLGEPGFLLFMGAQALGQ
jgi:hypothetical protein